MGSVTIGGDPTQYMDPPTLRVSDSGDGPSFIASILDALGIHKQAAKAPAQPSSAEAPATNPAPEPKVESKSLPILEESSNAFEPVGPSNPGWSQRYLDSLKPLLKFDPNDFGL